MSASNKKRQSGGGDPNAPSKRARQDARKEKLDELNDAMSGEGRKKERKLKQEVRKMGEMLAEGKTEQLKPGSNKLTEFLMQTDDIASQIKTTHVSSMESDLLLQIVKRGVQRAQNIDASVIELNPGSLTDKFVAFLKDRRFAVEDGMSSVTTACPNWGKLGLVALRYSRITPTMEFMNGAISMDVAKIVKVQGPRIKKMNELTAVKPHEGVDKEYEKLGDTDAIGQAINKVLHEYFLHWYDNDRTGEADDDGSYVELMKLVTNPKCYAQTVENLFYLSQLVTNGSVRMKMLADGQMAVSHRPLVEGEEEFEAIDQRKHQSSMVWEITMAAWKEAIEAFEVKNSMVPHRDYSKLNM